MLGSQLIAFARPGGCPRSFFLLIGILSNTLPSHLYWWWKAYIPLHSLSTPFSESISFPNALFFVGFRGGGGGLHRQSTQAALSSTPRSRRFRRKKQKRVDAIRDFAGGRRRFPTVDLAAEDAPGRRFRDLRESRGIGLRYQELEDCGNWGLWLRSRGRLVVPRRRRRRVKGGFLMMRSSFLCRLNGKKVVKIAHFVDVTNPDHFVGSPVVRKEEDVMVDFSEKLDTSMEDAANVSKEDVVDGEADGLDSDKLEEPVRRGEEGGKLENDKLEEVAVSGDAGLGVVGEGVEQGDGGNEGIATGKNEELKELKMEMNGERIGKGKVREGRRCGLCGGGVDGKPPSELVRDCGENENEAYGSSPLEERNYDMWDGFGDKPRWLGPLLGPIHDRFGITRVWLHQHCEVCFT